MTRHLRFAAAAVVVSAVCLGLTGCLVGLVGVVNVDPPPPLGNLTSSGGHLGQWTLYPHTCIHERKRGRRQDEELIELISRTTARGAPDASGTRLWLYQASGSYSGQIQLPGQRQDLADVLNDKTCKTFLFKPEDFGGQKHISSIAGRSR